MTDQISYAPGWPGIEPRWTSSAKSGVGTALSEASRVWFTLSHGIIDEVYAGRLDWACTRDLGFLITDNDGLFSDEKREAEHEVQYIAKGVPAYHLINRDPGGCYRIEKEILADPRRSVVLQRTRFVPLQGRLEDYHLYVILAPHLGNQGYGNTAWVGDTKGQTMLFAERDGSALALACTAPWLKRSAGFVGASDGWQDVAQHHEMTWAYERAENGNVALAAEVDLVACRGEFVLALGFGEHALEAGHHARGSLFEGFDAALAAYRRAWENWQSTLLHLEEDESRDSEYSISAAVLRIHEAKDFAGGIIASLSIPWGFARGDQDLGGYHLVWTRDLVETVGGLMAAGAKGDAARVLRYLQVTQEADGHWSQNMWLDGTPYWTGVQMDETAFPILLTAMAYREGLMGEHELAGLWPMVRCATSYVVRNGPLTEQDRWEENAGYSPFTLAVEIAALLAAAELAEIAGEPHLAGYLRETADAWNASIERWLYVTGTALAHEVGVAGYYVRLAPPEVGTGTPLAEATVPIKNRPPGQDTRPAWQVVSPDALALVRFGLRSARDPRIVNTLKVIDATLKLDTPYGPAWRRYNDDGYGEHEDGSPYDGTGIGRAWPLLTGERAHYELAAGHREQAERLTRTMESFANRGGMIPEQIWDAADIPERELCFARPSGSAMPLVWAHAEYVKLRRSLREGSVFDTPPQTVQRYLVNKTTSKHVTWRLNQRADTLPKGKTLRIEATTPAMVHWSAEDWDTVHDLEMRDTGLGVFLADLPTAGLHAGAIIQFTFFWPEANRWENVNYAVKVV